MHGRDENLAARSEGAAHEGHVLDPDQRRGTRALVEFPEPLSKGFLVVSHVWIASLMASKEVVHLW